MVVAAIAGGGGWLLLSPAEEQQGPPRPVQPRVLWSAPMEESAQASGTPGDRGFWLTSRHAVKALPDGVVAFDRKTGKQQWKVPTPGRGKVRCQASPQADGGVVVLAAGPGENACDTAWAVDIKRGKLLWKRALPQVDDEFALDEPARIARTGNTAVIEAADRIITTAFQVRTGRVLWHDKENADGCVGEDYTGGARLVRKTLCPSSTAGEAEDVSVVVVEPRTGRARWSRELDVETPTDVHIVHTSPVLLDHAKNLTVVRLEIHTPKGVTKLDRREEQLSSSLDEDGSPSPDVVVRKGMIVAAMARFRGEDEHNRMVAWSSSSGKRLWERQSTGYIQKYFPVETTGTAALLALSVGNNHHRVRLVKFARKNGKPTTVHAYKAAAVNGKGGGRPIPLLRDGTLYMTPGRGLTIPDDKLATVTALTAF